MGLGTLASPNEKVRGELIILLSGGIDSTTAAAVMAPQFPAHRALFVDYGQRARAEEAIAAAAVANALGLSLVTATCRIPCVSVVGEIPGRNAFLLHTALAVAGLGPATVALGIHAGTGYKDCTSDFASVMRQSFDFHANGAVQLLTPFVEKSKRDIWTMARDVGAPLELTYSCEEGAGPCGECRSCKDVEALRACS